MGFSHMPKKLLFTDQRFFFFFFFRAGLEFPGETSSFPMLASMGTHARPKEPGQRQAVLPRHAYQKGFNPGAQMDSMSTSRLHDMPAGSSGEYSLDSLHVCWPRRAARFPRAGVTVLLFPACAALSAIAQPRRRMSGARDIGEGCPRSADSARKKLESEEEE